MAVPVSDSAAPARDHGRRVLVRSCRPVGRVAIGHRSSPSRIRASCGPRTGPLGGHPAANAAANADATAELIRALHPGQRRGVDRFRVGWPPIELRLAWRDGAMHWQIDCPEQVVASVEMAVHSVLGRCELEGVRLDDPVPSAVATARLARAATRCLRPDATSASSVPLRLAVALDQAGTSAQVVLRIRLMPGAANDPDEEASGSRSAGSLSRRSSMRSSSERRPIRRPSKPAPARSTDQTTHVQRDHRPRSIGPEPAVAAALYGSS